MRGLLAFRSAWLPYGLAIAGVTGTTLLALLTQHALGSRFPPRLVSALFLAGVIVSTRLAGIGPGILAAVLSSLALELILLPHFSFLQLRWADAIVLAAFLLLAVVLGTADAQRRRAEREVYRSREQLGIARDIQRHFFPRFAPALPGFDIAAACLPAEETSGDFFDFLPLRDGSIGVVLADASGHGQGSALIMADVRAYLRALALTHDDVGEILTLANQLLAADLGGEGFCTLFLARLDPRNHSLVYAGAGHEGFLLAADGQVRRLAGTAPPLGVTASGVIPCAPVVQLDPGATVLVVTDGVTEARSPDGTPFGIHRALEVACGCRSRRAKETIQELAAELRGFAKPGPLQDDVSMVVLHMWPPGQDGGPSLGAAPLHAEPPTVEVHPLSGSCHDTVEIGTSAIVTR
jgi:serine phosphatase RsbU (regulator of sigma subunit)